MKTNTFVTHESISDETNLRKMGSKTILQFLFHLKFCESVHMHFYPGFRLCGHKVTDI